MCIMIKQNESEVGRDMLLVSDYSYVSNICQYHLKPNICKPYNFSV